MDALVLYYINNLIHLFKFNINNSLFIYLIKKSPVFCVTLQFELANLLNKKNKN